MNTGRLIRFFFYPILKPLTYIYQFFFWLDKKLKKPMCLSAFVISVGNLSMGGTGKTPFVIYLVKWLKEITVVPTAILMRGYHGELENTGSCWFDEPLPLVNNNPIEPGDEARLYRIHLPHTWLGIGSNRFQQGQTLIAAGAGILVLDDGLQHHKLKRNIDIVLMDAKNPEEGGIIPLGRLRQSMIILKKVDLIVLSRFSQASLMQQQKTIQLMKRLAPQVPFIKADHQPGQPYPLSRLKKYMLLGTDPTISDLLSKNHDNEQISFSTFQAPKIKNSMDLEGLSPILSNSLDWTAFSGLGQNDKFKKMIETDMGISLNQFISLPDHFNYTEKNVTDMLVKTKNFVLTTEKDAVKLARLNLPEKMIDRIFIIPLQLVLSDADQLTFSSLMHKWLLANRT